MSVRITAARRVQVYVGETDHLDHKPRAQAILEYLRREGAAGATVTRGVAGFGVHSRIHTASILDLSADLPMVVTWVDTREHVDRLLPGVVELAGSGIVTVEDVTVAGNADAHLHRTRNAGPAPGVTPPHKIEPENR
jgi:PII-like signaling protein